MRSYKQTPLEILRIITLFYKKNVRYNLFKCEHIFEGTNSNLDILFSSEANFRNARKILAEEGYILYMDENVEKYKEMWVKVENQTLYAIHLHQQVAWHNIKILDAKDILSRSQDITPIIKVPSFEDQLLIHAAHCIFENFKIRKREHNIISSLLKKELDWEYITRKSKNAGFYKQLHHVIKCVKDNKELSRHKSVITLLRKAVATPTCWVSVLSKMIKFVARKLSLKRRGSLVSLIGIQGAGKTTLTRYVLEKYKSISHFFHGQTGYYFGWLAFTPHAKLISFIFTKRKKKVFDTVNNIPVDSSGSKSDGKDNLTRKCSLSTELLFCYNFMEYYSRYLFLIYPKLRKGKLVVTDRYFYDIYAQYKDAPASRILPFLLKMYPKPDYLFVLDAATKTVMQRDKDPDVFAKVTKSSKRQGMKQERVEMERRRFVELSEMFAGTVLNTEQNKEIISSKIITATWKRLVQ